MTSNNPELTANQVGSTRSDVRVLGDFDRSSSYCLLIEALGPTAVTVETTDNGQYRVSLVLTAAEQEVFDRDAHASQARISQLIEEAACEFVCLVTEKDSDPETLNFVQQTKLGLVALTEGYAGAAQMEVDALVLFYDVVRNESRLKSTSLVDIAAALETVWIDIREKSRHDASLSQLTGVLRAQRNTLAAIREEREGTLINKLRSNLLPILRGEPAEVSDKND